MDKVFIPFNRYHANISHYNRSVTYDYKPENNYNMIPSDYNTTEEEISWYLNALAKAQKQNALYIKSAKKRISILFSLITIAICFLLEKVFNTDPLWYIGALVASAIFVPIVLLFVFENNKFDKWIKYIYRDMFFPPLQANVERFLSIYGMKQLEYYEKKYHQYHHS